MVSQGDSRRAEVQQQFDNSGSTIGGKFNVNMCEPDEAVKKHPLDLALTMRSFGAATTSSLPAADIVKELIRALDRERVLYTQPQSHKLICHSRVATSNGAKQPSRPQLQRRKTTINLQQLVSWEMEVCLLPKLGTFWISCCRVCTMWGRGLRGPRPGIHCARWRSLGLAWGCRTLCVCVYV